MDIDQIPGSPRICDVKEKLPHVGLNNKRYGTLLLQPLFVIPWIDENNFEATGACPWFQINLDCFMFLHKENWCAKGFDNLVPGIL